MSENQETSKTNDIRSKVREHYGNFASQSDPCCAPGCCESSESSESISLSLYETPQVDTLPVDVTGISAGCGDPVTLASLNPGETVLDLGSGGGIDCFLAAQKVGETGKVIGVDMTPEMLDKARANKAKLGVENVEFRLGEIEHIPAPDESVDVILSNCVINLSPDKPAVFRETFRVLKPGGRFAVTDIVTDGPLPEVIRENLAAWYGCAAGALDYRDYVAGLEAAGFSDVQVSRVEIEPSTITDELEKYGIEVPEPKPGEKTPKAIAMIDGKPVEFDLGEFNPPFSARLSARKPKA